MPSNLEAERAVLQPPPETAGRRRRVLIVDDEPGIRESLRLTLRDDYDLLLAETGEEALRVAQSSRPDVVLLDIVMPGMDGLAALERLKAFDPCLPVIMVTATRTIKTAVTAIKLGAYDYIQKPFEIEDLRIILNNATRSAALEREVEELRAEVGRR
jgi:DNA-binding NtrC family response regulator